MRRCSTMYRTEPKRGERTLGIALHAHSGWSKPPKWRRDPSPASFQRCASPLYLQLGSFKPCFVLARPLALPNSNPLLLPIDLVILDGELSSSSSQEPYPSQSHDPMDNSHGGIMRAAGPGAVRRTPEDVFRDFRARQQGLLKAFTTEVDRFYQMCDPEKENLCLYGLPNETWEVNLPAEEVPPELPEPALGINFARDGMNDKDWLSLVAVHSDSWLLSVAFYFGARFGFDQDSRKRLFSMINSVPTIFEVVTGTDKRQPKEKTPKSDSKSIKSASKPTRQLEPIQRSSKIPLPEDKEASDGEEEKEQEDHESTLCGACGENYGQEEFWICCDLCEKWFHGKCVKITPTKAEHIKQYKCPNCSSSSKRARA